MIDWKLAPEGADRVVVRFYNGDEMSCKKAINRPAQTKTVADAVEYHNGVWPNDDYDYLNFDSKEGWYCSDKGLFVTLVCSRAEFETYVKEQEGEKWTHTYGEHRCRIKIDEPDLEGYIVVITECNGYIPCKPENLKPIKPTMTEEQQKMVAKFVARIYTIETSYNLRDEFDKFCNEHDII